MLREGTKNNIAEVKAWQQFLLDHNYPVGKVDGVFGPATTRETRHFQEFCGLTPDAQVGPLTLAQAVARGFAGFDSPATPTEPALPGKMKISAKGRDFIAGYEKMVLEVYDDGYGYPTVGIGHRTELPLKTKITKEQALTFFEQDLAEHAEPVDTLVKVPLTQNQYDALVSLVFNIGGPNFKKSTLLKKLNNLDYAGAAARFGDFNKSSGKVSKGLIKRREAERLIFVGDGV